MKFAFDVGHMGRNQTIEELHSVPYVFPDDFDFESEWEKAKQKVLVLRAQDRNPCQYGVYYDELSDYVANEVANRSDISPQLIFRKWRSKWMDGIIDEHADVFILFDVPSSEQFMGELIGVLDDFDADYKSFRIHTQNNEPCRNGEFENSTNICDYEVDFYYSRHEGRDSDGCF